MKVEEVPAGEAILLRCCPDMSLRWNALQWRRLRKDGSGVHYPAAYGLMQKLLPLRPNGFYRHYPPILEAAAALSPTLGDPAARDKRAPRGGRARRRVRQPFQGRLSARTQTMDPAAVKPEQCAPMWLRFSTACDSMASPVCQTPKAVRKARDSAGIVDVGGKTSQKKYFWPVVGSPRE